jgi:hypothetical protein
MSSATPPAALGAAAGACCGYALDQRHDQNRDQPRYYDRDANRGFYVDPQTSRTYWDDGQHRG